MTLQVEKNSIDEFTKLAGTLEFSEYKNDGGALKFDKDSWHIVHSEWPEHKIKINLLDKYKKHRRAGYALTKDPLAKALGLKGDKKSVIVDLSGGLGGDSILLLAFKQKLITIERNPYLHFLLARERERLVQEFPELEENFELRNEEGRSFIHAQDHQVFLFDPMYPHERVESKALNKIEMRMLRSLLGEDLDSADVLQAAKDKGVQRFVVKRPLRGEPLAPGYAHQIKGKSTRFDVYLPNLNPACENSATSNKG